MIEIWCLRVHFMGVDSYFELYGEQEALERYVEEWRETAEAGVSTIVDLKGICNSLDRAPVRLVIPVSEIKAMSLVRQYG